MLVAQLNILELDVPSKAKTILSYLNTNAGKYVTWTQDLWVKYLNCSDSYFRRMVRLLVNKGLVAYDPQKGRRNSDGSYYTPPKKMTLLVSDSDYSPVGTSEAHKHVIKRTTSLKAKKVTGTTSPTSTGTGSTDPTGTPSSDHKGEPEGEPKEKYLKNTISTKSSISEEKGEAAACDKTLNLTAEVPPATIKETLIYPEPPEENMAASKKYEPFSKPTQETKPKSAEEVVTALKNGTMQKNTYHAKRGDVTKTGVSHALKVIENHFGVISPKKKLTLDKAGTAKANNSINSLAKMAGTRRSALQLMAMSLKNWGLWQKHLEKKVTPKNSPTLYSAMTTDNHTYLIEFANKYPDLLSHIDIDDILGSKTEAPQLNTSGEKAPTNTTTPPSRNKAPKTIQAPSTPSGGSFDMEGF